MPTENNYTLTGGTFYIDGEKFVEVPDLEYDFEAYEEFSKDEIRKNTVIGLNAQGELTATIKTKIDPFAFFMLTGIYDWVVTYCPNRRVVHLIKNGKNRRVKYKNFKRAVCILGRLLDKGRKLNENHQRHN